MPAARPMAEAGGFATFDLSKPSGCFSLKGSASCESRSSECHSRAGQLGRVSLRASKVRPVN
jgi:hypothetical protein